MLNPAPLESARFGLRIFRTVAHSLNAAILVSELIEQQADVAILRLSSQAANGLSEIRAFGLVPIHADTLVNYECRLQDSLPRPLKNSSENIRVATPSDAGAITDLMRAVFSEYPNHYHANPLLDRRGALDGYCEWAVNHIDGPGRVTWISTVGDRVAAIACSSFDEQSRTCQGVLHGVHPDFGGNGHYTDLIRYTQIHFRELGYRRLNIATQAGNLQVQKVWARESFSLAEILETFHVNALLDTRKPGSLNSSLKFAKAAIPDKRRVLSQFLDSASEALGNSGAAIRSCIGAILEMPFAGQPYFLDVHPHRCMDASGSVIWSATLRDREGRICGIAQFTSAGEP